MTESLIIFTIAILIFITFQLTFAFLAGRHLCNSLDSQTLILVMKKEIGTDYDRFVVRTYSWMKWRIK